MTFIYMTLLNYLSQFKYILIICHLTYIITTLTYTYYMNIILGGIDHRIKTENAPPGLVHCTGRGIPM